MLFIILRNQLSVGWSSSTEAFFRASIVSTISATFALLPINTTGVQNVWTFWVLKPPNEYRTGTSLRLKTRSPFGYRAANRARFPTEIHWNPDSFTDLKTWFSGSANWTKNPTSAEPFCTASTTAVLESTSTRLWLTIPASGSVAADPEPFTTAIRTRRIRSTLAHELPSLARVSDLPNAIRHSEPISVRMMLIFPDNVGSSPIILAKTFPWVNPIANGVFATSSTIAGDPAVLTLFEPKKIFFKTSCALRSEGIVVGPLGPSDIDLDLLCFCDRDCCRNKKHKQHPDFSHQTFLSHCRGFD